MIKYHVCTRKKTAQIKLVKKYYMQNHFAIAKFKIPKGLKGKKNHKLPPFGKFTEVATRGVL